MIRSRVRVRLPRVPGSCLGKSTGNIKTPLLVKRTRRVPSRVGVCAPNASKTRIALGAAAPSLSARQHQVCRRGSTKSVGAAAPDLSARQHQVCRRGSTNLSARQHLICWRGSTRLVGAAAPNCRRGSTRLDGAAAPDFLGAAAPRLFLLRLYYVRSSILTVRLERSNFVVQS